MISRFATQYANERWRRKHSRHGEGTRRGTSGEMHFLCGLFRVRRLLSRFACVDMDDAMLATA